MSHDKTAPARPVYHAAGDARPRHGLSGPLQLPVDQLSKQAVDNIRAAPDGMLSFRIASNEDGGQSAPAPQEALTRRASEAFSALAQLYGVSINTHQNAAVQGLTRVHNDATYGIMVHTDRQLEHSRHQTAVAKQRLEVIRVALDVAQVMRSLVYEATAECKWKLYVEKVRKGTRRHKEIQAQLATLEGYCFQAEEQYAKLYETFTKPDAV